MRLLAALLLSTCALAAEDPAQLIDQAGALPTEAALERYDQALAQLGPERQPQLWLRALAGKCWLITHTQPQAAIALVEQFAPHASTLGRELDWAQLSVCGGYAWQRLDQPARALSAFDAGVDAALAAHDLKLLSRALALRGELHYQRGAWGQAMSDLKAAFDAADQLGDLEQRTYTLTAIANLYGSVGEHARAIEYYRQTLDIARSSGHRQNEATALYNLGVSHDKLGQPEQALAHYREALAVQREADIAEDVPDTLRSMAISLLKLGRPGEALAQLDEAARLPAAAGPEMQAALALTRAAALRLLGRPQESLPLLDQAQAWFEPHEERPFLEKIADERAQALSALGRPAEALAARERQLQLKEALHQAWRAEQTARLRVEFDTDRTEQENRRLASENALRSAALRDAERIRALQSGVIAAVLLALTALVALLLLQLRHARRLRQIATTDELTALPNRRATLAYVRDQLARGTQPIGVIALDIDHFKQINDRYGHEAGDVVLKRVAASLRQHVDRGLIGRIGGEEFLALMPAHDRERSAALADTLRQRIAAIDLSDVAQTLTVSASFGIAEIRDQDWQGAVRRADAALYRAKHAGRNRVEVAAGAA
ncbi:MAG: tetratricopeptide repeat protein [Lysobacterales bacterium]